MMTFRERYKYSIPLPLIWLILIAQKNLWILQKSRKLFRMRRDNGFLKLNLNFLNFGNQIQRICI